ncbi:Galactoside O-acetyltransferase [Lachnospiraceae bacterium TWA4]|nr:Galactoside O-acetyltransferase [Lachnospiraceae bacterium TWA4]
MKLAKERIHTGDLYLPDDKELFAIQLKKLDKLYDFNQTRPTELDKRASMLKEMFAEIGENCYIEPPFHANFGGAHCHFGDHVYANFNLTMVDDTHIYVGSYTMFGPNVTVATAGHPIYPDLRQNNYQYNFSVHIGKNCWIGAGAIILPGITIGDNVVIGAGSVVTKDLPSNVVAVGNPCKVLRPIGKKDIETYFKDRAIDWDCIEEEVGIKKPN